MSNKREKYGGAAMKLRSGGGSEFDEENKRDH
jgi:hypothetical protein